MSKQFTKVTQTYSTKNKLQLLILENLQAVDGSLFKNKSEAIGTIKTLFKAALNEYKGSAKLPELKNYEPHKNSHVYHVDEVINISIYNVQNDLA
ncbi:hypothetical protein GON26_01205 [Flavobacterium sp. GA093]|uniref:Uncharacterized protein n=1 Tax=Flavobacterium hydrocarbonoxydans TaxID=2683249 RepID=A0A6I4NPJ7_9FLAO|nr:hypothetical protein [Flavobacterium hydrocarbonoxydans]MWB92967.1 hypothetical protein [Flavobacterium hydrocarbonoxydans]